MGFSRCCSLFFLSFLFFFSFNSCSCAQMEKHLVRKQQISVFRLEFCSHRSSISMQLRMLYFFLALTFLHTQFMPSFRERKVMLVKRREKESPNPTQPPFCEHRVLPPHLAPSCLLVPKNAVGKKTSVSLLGRCCHTEVIKSFI